MQNMYVGDIGDYGKFGLMRQLQNTGLSIGINWYFTSKEEHNNDGKHTKYLDEKLFQEYDPSLWDELKKIVDNNNRDIQALESSGILQAKYYSEELSFSEKSKAERKRIREEWHQNARKFLKNTDIVLVDPDNGIVTSSSKDSGKENKYVTIPELIDYYTQGSTVIYYQHKARRPDRFYIDQHAKILSEPWLKDASGLLLKFCKTSHRFYGFIIQPHHYEIIKDAVDSMLKSLWKELFQLID